jgi:hypothetical protein
MKKITTITTIAALAVIGILTPGIASAEPINSVTGNNGWYTEGDDAAPTVTDEGTLFEDAGSIATGIRVASDFPLSALPTITYTATGEGTEFFHVRLVVDNVEDAEVTGNRRDDYQSLSVLSGSPVTLDSTVWVPGANVSITIAEYLEANAGTVVTSVGFHLDTNAPEGTAVLVTSSNLHGKAISATRHAAK